MQNVSPLSGIQLWATDALNESWIPNRSLNICFANAGRVWNDGDRELRASNMFFRRDDEYWD
jgi:hypothetical protein